MKNQIQKVSKCCLAPISKINKTENRCQGCQGQCSEVEIEEVQPLPEYLQPEKIIDTFASWNTENNIGETLEKMFLKWVTTDRYVLQTQEEKETDTLSYSIIADVIRKSEARNAFQKSNVL